MRKKIALLSTLVILLTLTACGPFRTIITIKTSDPNSNSFDDTSYVPPIDGGDAKVSKVKMKYNYHDLFDNHMFYNVDAQPTLSKVKANGELEPINILVIPVKFHDYSANATEKVRQDIEKAYFGTPEETGWHSVSSYYYEESYGKLKLEGIVTPWYETNRSYKTIGDTSKDKTNDTAFLVQEAVNWYKNTFHDDCKRFDSDKDGLIDSVALIYNAPYRTKPTDNSELWAYCFWTDPKPKPSSPNPCAYFFASYKFMYDDTRYCNLDAHTYIHEHGHIMGLEDYYNYDSHSKYCPVGGFTMQDHNVGGHDPFSKLAYNWIEPFVIDGQGTVDVTLRPGTLYGDALILTNKSSEEFNSPFDEYIIIDYYTPEGVNEFDSKHHYCNKYPQGPKTRGLRVWHVDARLLKNYKNPKNYELATEIITDEFYRTAMTNTTVTYPNDEYAIRYASLIPEFRNYKLLHLLQKGKVNTFAVGDYFSSDDLWTKGDIFTMRDYSNFFVNNGRLNDGSKLKMSFEVLNIGEDEATLRVNKY